MGDDDGGPALGGLVERPHDAVLGDRVQAGGGFVKHEDGRVLEDGPGYRHPLLLSSAELEAPLSHLGVITTGPLQNAETSIRMKYSTELGEKAPSLRRRLLKAPLLFCSCLLTFEIAINT